MKKIIVLIVISALGFSLNAQSRKERKAEKKAQLETKYQELKGLIDSKQFMFEANWAIPLGNDVSNIGLNIPGGGAVFQGGRVDISNNSNFLKLNGASADLFLPFFGRVFVPDITSSSRGIQFKGEIQDYTVDYNKKKKRAIVKFNAKNYGDFLKFILNISASGKTTVSVNSTKRQSITYDGFLAPLHDQK
ncbi:DUF4251 domain-containing protein [Winogradskyella litorisediminis]|uniref:DUF4251 domain-containing protein n=1 Tax=Winogradskyella litorisediminis TaxID=1156618 RepID=A0ABW3N4H9_9FLAO